ncbi:MAG TPA: sugar phosphate isomerase/epimerase family protein [Chthonomonadaceae bacterium]|nr:sugar phosphate isomerase/epimerase family protein [Chthonomonadaceae bacterium]
MALEPMAIGVIVGGGDPLAGIAKVKSLGLNNCQMGVPAPQWRSGEKLEQVRRALAEQAVTVTCVFCGFPGESYADIPTIRATVGLVPPSKRAERLQIARESSDAAQAIGAPVLAAHIGFVPDDRDHADYRGTLAAIQALCDHCAANGQKFALETGQETAETLLQFIQDVDRPNLGVNFDPANMMLYGSGDPIAALDLVGKYVIGVHCKDGDYPAKPGTLGHEYPLGEGKVGFPRFLQKLRDIGYTGPLTIEREISGEQQTRDIRAAIQRLEEWKRHLTV